MTTANSEAIMEGATPTPGPVVPHTGVINNREPVGISSAPWITGGAPEAPRVETRPGTNSIALAYRLDEQTWQDDRPLPGWHGVVGGVNTDAHIGQMEPDYTPRDTIRNAPVVAWNAGSEIGASTVRF